MRRATSVLAIALALAAPLALGTFGAASADEPAAPEPAPSASASTSSSAATKPPAKSAPASEIEVVTLEGDPEYDRQRFAVGLQGGGGWITTKGSGAGAGFANFAFLGEFGLGTYGARIPWTLEVFAGFALNRQSFSGDSTSHPNRFTEAGARIVLRGDSGLLENRWLSLGAGIVFTSHGTTDSPTGGDIAPGGLIDVGFGVHEWTTRLVRYGFGARVPVELSKHPGIGVIGFFYAQVGLGG